MCIVGHQYFTSKILQIMISKEKFPPPTPSCISYSIVGISKSYKQRFKTWSWPRHYNFLQIKKNVNISKLIFIFVHGHCELFLFPIVKYSVISYNHTNCKRKSRTSIIWFGTPISFVRLNIRDEAFVTKWNLLGL